MWKLLHRYDIKVILNCLFVTKIAITFYVKYINKIDLFKENKYKQPARVIYIQIAFKLYYM